jgi:UPF0042 nucleotide-binding protein
VSRSAERKVFVISGISGAGKSQALKSFEDLGFFCVDNLPVALLDQFADHLIKTHHRRVALGMDIREGKLLAGLPTVIKRIADRGIEAKVLFLDASDTAVIQRFSETRHRHPLGLKIADAIKEERRRLLPIKEIADKVIDTSAMTLGELKEAISQTLGLTRTREMTLSVVSFGYKYGIPMDADIVMDVRFLPNPNYVRGLRHKTGLMAPVQRYIKAQPAAKRFLHDYLKLVAGLLPHYVREGKSYLTIAIGCTGGHHRSVFITHYLADKLRGSGYPVQEFHRDINH